MNIVKSLLLSILLCLLLSKQHCLAQEAIDASIEATDTGVVVNAEGFRVRTTENDIDLLLEITKLQEENEILKGKLAIYQEESLTLDQINDVVDNTLSSLIPMDDELATDDSLSGLDKFASYLRQRVLNILQKHEKQIALLTTKEETESLEEKMNLLEKRLKYVEENELLQYDSLLSCGQHCHAGEYVDKICNTSATPPTKTVCKECTGQTWSPGGLQHECRQCSVCQPGYYEESPCNKVQDTICKPCKDGYFANSTALSKCTLCDSTLLCPAGYKFKGSCSASTGKPNCEECQENTYLSTSSRSSTCTVCDKVCPDGVTPVRFCGKHYRGICIDPAIGFIPIGKSDPIANWKFRIYGLGKPFNAFSNKCGANHVQRPGGKYGPKPKPDPNGCEIGDEITSFTIDPSTKFVSKAWPLAIQGNLYNEPGFNDVPGKWQYKYITITQKIEVSGGDWYFRCGADDLARVVLDGKTILNKEDYFGSGGQVVLKLTAGNHDLEYQYAEYQGGSNFYFCATPYVNGKKKC
eukprot:m.30252 g.30252  ORF g.30252 m.30252 type:complete len:524 (+) comp8188_c1_seq2:232-1803(+)